MFDDFDIRTIVLRYIFGVIGSIAVESAALLRAVAANHGRIPKTYYTWTYAIVRIIFTVVAAGPLAVLLAEKSAWTAFYIGITAPLIYDRAAAGIQVNGRDIASPAPPPESTEP